LYWWTNLVRPPLRLWPDILAVTELVQTGHPRVIPGDQDAGEGLRRHPRAGVPFIAAHKE
jgi:hypothetical protein